MSGLFPPPVRALHRRLGDTLASPSQLAQLNDCLNV